MINQLPSPEQQITKLENWFAPKSVAFRATLMAFELGIFYAYFESTGKSGLIAVVGLATWFLARELGSTFTRRDKIRRLKSPERL